MKTTTDRQLATTSQGGRGQRTPLEIEKAIRGLARDNFTPTQIHRLLKDNEKLLKGHKLTDLRTVQRIVRKVVPPDTSGWWSVAEAEPEDAALVLPVLAKAIERSGGGWQHFGGDIAAWIIRVRRAAPDLPPLWTLYVAQSYRFLERNKRSLDTMDQMLAFAPWRGMPELCRYLRAMRTIHADWFEVLDLDSIDGRPISNAVEGVYADTAGSPVIKLADDGLLWNPAAEGLSVALDCWQTEQEDAHD